MSLPGRGARQENREREAGKPPLGDSPGAQPNPARRLPPLRSSPDSETLAVRVLEPSGAGGGMAAAAAEQALLDLLLPQIHALFSDPLRVVSYKWLSRNFSVSSNDAKRLLQEFVNKHGTDLQVIYSVSGWLKNSPQNYRVKLTSGLKLEVTKQEFKDPFSIQIYSIQASIPKDTAVLWNPEFVQAEELFNRPFDEENCLRDNRFCGVLNPFVKRISSGKHVSSPPPKPINNATAAAGSKPSIISKGQAQQDLPGPCNPKQVIGNKAEKDNSSAIVKDSNDPVVKEPSTAVHASKNKAQNGKAQSGNGGSLATMWGRASSKPKPPITTNSTAAATVAATADAQICAKEEANADSSDDEQRINYKRGSNGANNRKRRAVFDFSDDEEEENVGSIASPERPAQLAPDPVTEALEHIKENQKKLESEKDKPNNVKNCLEGMDSDLFSECKAKSANTTNHSGITLKEKSSDPPINDSKQNQAAEPALTSPKRRKVLKTRIDERGREVTEVVWEGEATAGDKAEKNVGNTAAGSRATLPSKPPPASNADKSKASSKSAASKKPAKAGTKQGNIMSFFKKI